MECDYCGKEIGETTGKLYVRKNGNKYHFCSGKCEKHWKNNRNMEYADEG